MPRKSLTPKTRKTSSKQGKATRQASPQREKRISEIVSVDNRMDYIDIYERNPETEKKMRLLWLITIPVALLLIVFWFWLLKQNITSASREGSINDLRDEISKTMTEIKNNMNSRQLLETSTTEEVQDINEIKNQVVEQLQKNLDPQTWPSHDSEIMAISVKYPPEWSQNEQNESITISAPSIHNASSSETSTDKTYSRISISRESASAKLKFEDWLKKNAPTKNEYTIKTSTSSPTIDGKKAAIYDRIGLTSEDINQIIFVQNGKFIYQIQIDVLGRKTLDESYINGIINTIKFLP